MSSINLNIKTVFPVMRISIILSSLSAFPPGGVSWFIPFKEPKPWRPPLRERQQFTTTHSRFDVPQPYDRRSVEPMYPPQVYVANYVTEANYDESAEKRFDLQVGSVFMLDASVGMGGGGFQKRVWLLNLRALKISMLYKNHIFQCMGKIFFVEFQRVPLKCHTK